MLLPFYQSAMKLLILQIFKRVSLKQFAEILRWQFVLQKHPTCSNSNNIFSYLLKRCWNSLMQFLIAMSGSFLETQLFWCLRHLIVPNSTFRCFTPPDIISGQALHDCLLQLTRHGLVVVDAPAERGIVTQLIKLINYATMTHFGLSLQSERWGN